jgi:hypothetical protein
MAKKNLTRNKSLIVRVTQDERDFIMKKVEKSGCRTFNLYALMMLVCGSTKNVDLSHYHELANEVNKIGVNINQIARVANTTGSISEDEIKNLQGRVDEIWQLLKSSLSQIQSTNR